MANDSEPVRLLLSRKEVAAIAGVTTKTIARWEAQGLLTRVALGGAQPRYARADVERLTRGVVVLKQPHHSTDLVELARRFEAERPWRKVGEEDATSAGEDPAPAPRAKLKVRKRKQRGET